MSYPANPLASYRSYSYYHVLAICNSSETAYELSKITSTDVWAHATDNGILGPYSPKKLSVDASKQDMEYCILINGSSDASYVITKASWNSSTAAGATPNDRYTSVAVEGSITISEPKGIMFLDQTIQCCKALGVDSASATFVLKTFFIGYGYEPSVGEFVDVLSDIPPLQFVATLVTGAFTEAGGEYVMNLS